MIPISKNIPFAELPMEVKNKMQDLKDWQIVEITKTTDDDGYLCYNVIQINGHLVFFVNALKTSYDDEWFFINKTYSLAYLEGLKKAKEFLEKRAK